MESGRRRRLHGKSETIGRALIGKFCGQVMGIGLFGNLEM